MKSQTQCAGGINCSKQIFSDVVGSIEAFYSLMIRSQSYNEHVFLSTEFQKCLSTFSLTLSETKWLEGTWVGYLPSLRSVNLKTQQNPID